jgi:hypothetical protein
MEDLSPAVHRTIVAVDVEGFGNRYRTNRNQLTVRDGLYRAMLRAFGRAGIPWTDCDHEDRGDGMFLLVGPEVPKARFVESLLPALVQAIQEHNDGLPDPERIRLRLALHAGEVNYDLHGATAASINLTFRLLDCGPVKEALASSPGVLAVIISSWFFEEVVWHSVVDATAYHRVPVMVKETATTGWVCLPDFKDWPGPAPVATAATYRVPEDQLGRCRQALVLAHQAALTEPIMPTRELPAGLRIPTLGEGYIDHRIRAAEINSAAEPGSESWWARLPVHDDACRFLLTELTAPTARTVPLILLGQPGSGKSVLTRVLAARLATAGLLPIRVELRQVSAVAELQDQIEFAVRSATGEIVSWPQLAQSAVGTLPVVIFDGLDELLQATGVAHNDFLLRVQAFQEREARLRRPLAVIVTSRTAITDRAMIPDGATAVQLEPFDEQQIRAWLDVWERVNMRPLAGRGMRPLPVEVALNYPELAEQPLLLLMLALYDADTGALQRRSATLGRTELYGQLLRDFARREVRKHVSALPEAELEQAVEAELLRLSVVAFAMFNRGSQWVLEADLDADFSALLANPQLPGSARWPFPLDQANRAQLTIGRFFFVQESLATQDDRQLRAYEFLHATFGEFLVAWLTVRVLALTAAAGTTAAAPRGGTDDGMLYALLSFAALTARSPVVGFVGDLFDRLDPSARAAVADLVLALHTRALFPRADADYRSYQPAALNVITRHAAWSANLVVLAVLAAGKVTGRQLFPGEPDTVVRWREEAMIWRSQLAGLGWSGLHETLSLDRIWDGQRREILLSRNDGISEEADPDIYWIYSIPPGTATGKGVFGARSHNSRMMRRKINFACNMSEDTMVHGLLPVSSSFPALANVFVAIGEDRVISATHALLAALYAPYKDAAREDSAYADLAYVADKLAHAPDMNADNSYLKAALAVLISAVQRDAAPLASLQPFAGLTSDGHDPELAELLTCLTGLLAGHA